jgi:hypothetical protein
MEVPQIIQKKLLHEVSLRYGISIGCFDQNLGTVSAFYAVFVAAMLAIEVAQRNGHLYLWMKHIPSLYFWIPWNLRNR